MPLLSARRGSNLRRTVRARPEIFGIVLTPYLAASWKPPTRIARFVDHHRTVAAIGGIVDFPPDIMIDVVRLTAIDSRYRITLDQARWLLLEGPLVMSLWDGTHRIFHLGFCLSSENGRRIAYIGSVQGRREIDAGNGEGDMLGVYRGFTKAAAAMRPRDFLVEVFRMFCKALDVAEIRAVAEYNHPQRQAVSDVKLSYDDIWVERGGRQGDDGFFVLPVDAARRGDNDIPTKKKAMYAKRYAMLDLIEADLIAALRSSLDLSATEPAVAN